MLGATQGSRISALISLSSIPPQTAMLHHHHSPMEQLLMQRGRKRPSTGHLWAELVSLELPLSSRVVTARTSTRCFDGCLGTTALSPAQPAGMAAALCKIGALPLASP